jgi:hypothetical protein
MCGTFTGLTELQENFHFGKIRQILKEQGRVLTEIGPKFGFLGKIQSNFAI